MKLWPLFSIFLLTQQSLLLGQSALADKGVDALAAGLWEIAEVHFRESLADPKLTSEAQPEVAMRLCEALIRAGNAAEALEWTGKSLLANHPELPFWKAQALAGLGRFKEAADLLSQLTGSANAPHRVEAGFTLASLQLALDLPDAALESLSGMIPGSDPATGARIQLYQTEILLDLDRIAAAREVIPAETSVSISDRPLAAFLAAQLLLKEDRAAEAEAGFQALVDQPQGQSLTRHHSAILGLADAVAAQGAPDAASLVLLKFAEEHPDSPMLQPAFERIIHWLPAKLTASDPTLEKISTWITPPALPAIGPISILSGAAAAWPLYPSPDPLLEHALYARAVGLHRVGSPESQAEAKRLINRLRLEHPDHPMTDRAIFLLAKWTLEAGSTDLAFSILETLRGDAKPSELKGRASFLGARLAHLKGDASQAIQLFDEAAESLSGANARVAKLQSAIARLRSGNHQGTTLIQQTDRADDKTLEADLELERALTTVAPVERLAAIEDFLTRVPEHPRVPEARLAAAEAALAMPSPNLAFARAQLDTLAATPGYDPGSSAPRIALARLRIADLAGDAGAVQTEAQNLIQMYPQQPEAAEAALTLGRKLFQAGDYNPARLVLEKLAASDTDPTRSQVAWLLAARAAALGGTPQSKEEALILFDNAISTRGPVTSIAHLEKARHLIDMYRLPLASEFLRKWIGTFSENDPLHLPAGLLLGEALYAQGSTRPESLLEALAVYDKLLSHAQTQPSLLNRLQYLRGNTLEQLPDEKVPGRKREKEAIQAYYSVLEAAETPVEWEYFERCGFKALALLEKAGRWSVAITVAKKIASFKGPRADEAAARARQLQLKHMHWED